MSPTRWLSASEIPGLNSMLMVSVPSLKGGRNERGNWNASAPAATTPASVTLISSRGRRKAPSRRMRLPALSLRISQLSRSSSRRMRGRR